MEIDYGFFRDFGPYFIEQSLGTFKIFIFGLWSFILHPYLRVQEISDIGFMVKYNIEFKFYKKVNSKIVLL